MTDFSQMGLIQELINVIEKKGYKEPTPIQEKSIPLLLENHDLLGIAQTGTGKTAAFALPLINKIVTNRIKAKPARMRSLILVPTRELAIQIEESIKNYSKQVKLSFKAIYGGVGHRPQIMAMAKGVDVVIATPGRFIELIDEGHVFFEQLETFIIDEADRMFEMGFRKDIDKVISLLPEKRQNLLFSATMPKSIEEFAMQLLTDPKKVEVSPAGKTADKVEQSIYLVERSNKPLLLKSVLKNKKFKSVLIFTRTKHGADRVLKHLLKNEIKSAAIHGNKSQGARERALNNFKKQRIRVLVATDVAARGLDIPHVNLVINYHLPEDPKNYVHRIGRTARAGKDGVALSFCDNDEKALVLKIEEEIGMAISIDESHPYHGVEAHFSKKKK